MKDKEQSLIDAARYAALAVARNWKEYLRTLERNLSA